MQEIASAHTAPKYSQGGEKFATKPFAVSNAPSSE